MRHITEKRTQQKRLMMDLMSREETPDDPEIPPSVFTEERMQNFKIVILGANAKTWGLEIRQQTPDFGALERLLDARYHNSEDDIEHDEIFSSA